MTPTYCAFHRHFTDGPCVAGKRSLNRHYLTLRIGDITAALDDDESAQSRGYLGNKALEIERSQLEMVRGVLP